MFCHVTDNMCSVTSISIYVILNFLQYNFQFIVALYTTFHLHILLLFFSPIILQPTMYSYPTLPLWLRLLLHFVQPLFSLFRFFFSPIISHLTVTLSPLITLSSLPYNFAICWENFRTQWLLKSNFKIELNLLTKLPSICFVSTFSIDFYLK